MRISSSILLLATSSLLVLAQDDEIVVDTTQLSHVLDRLTNKTIYDKRLRPRYGEKPVDVGITIHVSSISAVSEVDMDFTLDFYMRQTWQDPRLAFGTLDLGMAKQITSLTVGVDYLEKLWKPDTFFPNEKKSFFHVATTHNSFLRIDGDGTVFTSQRLTVTATCPMKLQLFPMDSQRCKLEIESYGYTTATIEYHWCGRANPNCPTAVKANDVELPSYRFAQFCVNRTMATTSSGSYSRLILHLIFDRESGFYMLQIFLPAALVVVISWVSFWISRDSAPSRTVIGVTTVLTETHLMTGTNRRLPPVAYIKAVDVYLGFCYLLVVLALIEYACVAYTKKKNEDRKRRERKNEHKPAAPPPDLLQDARLAECTCNAAPTSIIAVIKQPNRFTCIRHSYIDMVSRLAFPCVFLIFNAFFWVVLLAKANRLPYFSSRSASRC